MQIKIGILEKSFFSEKALKKLSMIGSIHLYNGGKLDEFLMDKDVLFIRLNYYINKDFLDKSEKLKYICSPTTGLNHIEMNEVKKRNINIISLKGESEFLSKIRATPEHIFGLTIALLRKYREAFMNEGNFLWDRDMYKGEELFNNKVGIIGMGRIGQILAKYFSCFGATVYYYDIKKEIDVDNAIKVNDISCLISKSNIVLLCASYSKKYHEFFNKYYIDLMKNKYFINASRGELVDENYLIKKIEENFFKGIALDVISSETQKNNLNLFLRQMNKCNFIMTPHIGGNTFESTTKTEDFIVGKLYKCMADI